MKDLFEYILSNYNKEKNNEFKNNPLANRIRQDLPKAIKTLLPDNNRYKVVGSPGLGNWADCPWVAIFDILVTKTAQNGFYPVFLFKPDMSGVYLSLNQGVTNIKHDYKKDTKHILNIRAHDFRAKLNPKDELPSIKLDSNSEMAKLYEHGSILAKFYSKNNFPEKDEIKKDILIFLEYYNELIFSRNEQIEDYSSALSVLEKKQLRLHFTIDRNSTISEKVKKIKGYTCEVCNFNFIKKYGDLGTNFIEAHHLKPLSELELGKIKLNVNTDFAVLCSNCHRIIHRLDNPGDLHELKKIISSNKN